MLLKENPYNEMNHFLRIANARLKSIYKFAPQRRAIAAKMYARWFDRRLKR